MESVSIQFPEQIRTDYNKLLKKHGNSHLFQTVHDTMATVRELLGNVTERTEHVVVKAGSGTEKSMAFRGDPEEVITATVRQIGDTLFSIVEERRVAIREQVSRLKNPGGSFLVDLDTVQTVVLLKNCGYLNEPKGFTRTQAKNLLLFKDPILTALNLNRQDLALIARPSTKKEIKKAEQLEKLLNDLKEWIRIELLQFRYSGPPFVRMKPAPPKPKPAPDLRL